MSEYEEALFICVFVGTVTILLPWVYRKYCLSRDSGKVISFIRESKYTFRSTAAIADGTGLTVERVEEVCIANGEIIQNKKRPDAWRVL